MKAVYALVALGLIGPPAPVLATDTPPSAKQEEILVLARKMQQGQLGLKFGRRDGILYVKSCKLAKSSGDSEADLIGCAAVNDCADLGFKKKRDFATCVKNRSLEKLEDLVERRANEREPM